MIFTTTACRPLGASGLLHTSLKIGRKHVLLSKNTLANNPIAVHITKNKNIEKQQQQQKTQHVPRNKVVTQPSDAYRLKQEGT